MVKGVSDMGMEACVTLGMLTESQAVRLKEAGLTAYNHNLDTSEEYYDNIITTRSYEDRLETLANVAKAGISACCGGILGMGKSQEDRISLLTTLANQTRSRKAYRSINCSWQAHRWICRGAGHL